MRVSLWVSKDGGFPSLFRGFLCRRESGGVYTLVLSSVERYTWENYHGKLLPESIPKDEALWDTHADQMLFIGFKVIEQDEQRSRYHNQRENTSITVFPLLEKT